MPDIPLIRQAHFISMLAKGTPIKLAAAKASIPTHLAPTVAADHGNDIGDWLTAAETYEKLLRGGATKPGRPPATAPKVVEKIVEVEVERVVEVPRTVEVPVEIATRYLDHPSPLVQATARTIAVDYRHLSSHVRLWDDTHPDEPFEPFDPYGPRPRHGDEAGYKRHQRAGEEPCEACRVGAQAARKARKEATKEAAA